MTKKRIYIDMDDTICNFTKAFHEKYTDKIKFPQATYGFFTNLEPIDGAIESIDRLRLEHDIWILTRPSVPNPLCYTEKRVWVEKYFGIDFCDRLIISPDKSLFIGDYLIDDRYHNFQGKLLLFGTDFRDWKEIMDYFDNK